MALTMIRRELKNARIYIIPEGTTVDALAVAQESGWPDADPITNWTDFQFVDIETVSEEKEIDTEEFKIPKAAGGYFTDTEQTLVSRKWKATTAKTNSLVKMLEHGLASIPVPGVPQAPFVNNNNYVDGVFLMEVQLKGGAISERTQVWARLRLVTAGDIGPTTSKVEIEIEQRESTKNTFVSY